MVCQAASQTRFRALKHENGIAGKPTIIVRVIACFQPLQDCQAEYFRHLLKPVTRLSGWMVKANTPWHSFQHSYQQQPDLNCMSTLLESWQQECLPSLANLSSCKFSAPLPLPGSSLQNLRTQHPNEVNGQLLHGYPSNFHAICPTPNPFFEGKKSAFSCGLDGTVSPNANFPGTCQKGFLVFDQSENQTRLIYNYFYRTIQNPSTADAKPVADYKDLHKAGRVAQMDQIDSTKSMFREASDTNDESEMHEDTEEINALLDSYDEDGDEIGSDDGYEEEDEVTSTGHSPIQIKEGCEKQELVGELVEEVASSDGPNKRQKKLDGGYNKSSPVYTASWVKLNGSHEYDNDAKSGYAGGLTGVTGSDRTFGNNRFKKDKIREILRVLESIVPGVKGKDPLLVIDEAIDYFRTAKINAETLGVGIH